MPNVSNSIEVEVVTMSIAEATKFCEKAYQLGYITRRQHEDMYAQFSIFNKHTPCRMKVVITNK